MQSYDHKVMRCTNWDQSLMKLPAAVSPKVDGIRAFYYPNESNLISRQGKPLYGMDHILEELKHYDYVVDMELFIPSMEFNKMSGLIRSYSPSPTTTAAIIDIPSSPLPFKDRVVYFNGFPRLGETVPINPWSHSPVVALPNYKVTTYKKVIELYNRFIAGGYEGLVYKTLTHKYRNSRSSDWMRVVPVLSADVKVAKIYEGTGKMKGMAGGFYAEWHNGTCKVGTMKGVDYEERINMFWNEADYIGRIAQIEFKNYQLSGKPRQPVFKRWRDDKC